MYAELHPAKMIDTIPTKSTAYKPNTAYNRSVHA